MPNGQTDQCGDCHVPVNGRTITDLPCQLPVGHDGNHEHRSRTVHAQWGTDLDGLADSAADPAEVIALDDHRHRDER